MGIILIILGFLLILASPNNTITIISFILFCTGIVITAYYISFLYLFSSFNKTITMRCSNCGNYNDYIEKEVMEVFPYSRETLICKYCNHTLSVCGGQFINLNDKK